MKDFGLLFKVKEEGLDKLKQKIKGVETSTQSADKSIKTMAISMAKYAVSIYAVNKALDGVASISKTFIGTTAKFEQFQTTLEAITGSSKEAEKSMAWIKDFTAKTPFELDKTTEAFVKMKAYGLDPINGTLTTLGDTASAMGKDVVEAVEALADAVTGENERLKEFGVKASKNGDKITYAWSDSSGKARHIVINNNKDIIQSTLNAIFNEKYAGAMDKQSKTWNGLMSNISDKWTLFQQDFMTEGGLFNYLKALLKTFSDTFSEILGKGKDSASEFSKSIIGGIEGVIKSMGYLSDYFSVANNSFKVFSTSFELGVRTIALFFQEGINTINIAWNQLLTVIKNTFKAYVDFIGSTFYKVIKYVLDLVNDAVNGMSSGLNKVFDFLNIDNPFQKINLSTVEYKSSIDNAIASTEKLIDTTTDKSKIGELSKELVENAKNLKTSYIDLFSGKGAQDAETFTKKIYKNLEEINKKEKESNENKKKANELLVEMGAKEGDVAKSTKEASKEAEKLRKEQEKIKELYEKNTVEGGMGAYFTELNDRITSFGDMTYNMFSNIEQGIGSAFQAFFDYTSEGFMNLKELGKGVLSGVLEGIQSVITEMLVMQAMQGFKALFGVVSFGGFDFGSLFSGLFANGGAFDNGIKKFATGGTFTNSIVSTPTSFNMGLMGEAGPEAIMPLTRTSGGDLGIKAEGIGTNVIINNYSSARISQSNQNGNTVLTIEDVKAAITQDIASGSGSVGETLQNIYNINRR